MSVYFAQISVYIWCQRNHGREINNARKEESFVRVWLTSRVKISSLRSTYSRSTRQKILHHILAFLLVHKVAVHVPSYASPDPNGFILNLFIKFDTKEANTHTTEDGLPSEAPSLFDSAQPRVGKV